MKLVVCFPGIGYHCDKPLLYYSRKLAACAGYDHTLLLQYTYHKDGLRGSPAALREAFDTLYAQAEAQLSAVDWPQYDDVLFLSKSIGTACPAECPCLFRHRRPLERCFLRRRRSPRQRHAALSL